MATTTTRYTIILPETVNGPTVYYDGVSPCGPDWTGELARAQSVGSRRDAQQCVKALRRYYKLPALRITPLAR